MYVLLLIDKTQDVVDLAAEIVHYTLSRVTHLFLLIIASSEPSPKKFRKISVRLSSHHTKVIQILHVLLQRSFVFIVQYFITKCTVNLLQLFQN